jgi:protein-disulfide isomerase
MRPHRLALILAGCVLALGGCQRPDNDKAFGERVRAYLLNHPEVLQEAMTKLQDKQQADAAQKQLAAIDQNRKALEHDPRDFVANPAGKVTVSEFYDYRCPHCVNAAPAVVALIHDHPNVRFVFKEFPIFGAASERAAAGAIAVAMAGGDGVGVYRDLMAARPLDEAALERILRAHGVDPAKLEQPDVKARIDAQLAATHQLAAALGVEGTPTFIIGDALIPGEDMDAVAAAIKHAGA